MKVPKGVKFDVYEDRIEATFKDRDTAMQFFAHQINEVGRLKSIEDDGPLMLTWRDGNA